MLNFRRSDFYFIVFITPASIYTVFLSSLHLLVNKDSFISPTSIYAVFFSSLHLPLITILSSLQLLLIQYSFHLSIFYLIKIISSLRLLFMQNVFINSASSYAVLFSSLLLLFIQCSFHYSSFCLYSFLFQHLFQLRVISNKSHFCWCKQLFSSFQLLFTQRISVVNQNSI